MLALETISCADLATVTGAANESAPAAPSEPGVASRVWQGVKDVSGGFVAGATTGRRDDQPWGNSSSQMSKLGGELGVMATGGFGQRIPRRR